MTRFEALALLPDKPFLSVYARHDDGKLRLKQQFPFEQVVNEFPVDGRYKLVRRKLQPKLGMFVYAAGFLRGKAVTCYVKADTKKAKSLSERFGISLTPTPKQILEATR